MHSEPSSSSVAQISVGSEVAKEIIKDNDIHTPGSTLLYYKLYDIWSSCSLG